MIKGTQNAVRAVRRILDAESGKPDQRHPYACECGAYAVTFADGEKETGLLISKVMSTGTTATGISGAA